MYRHRRHRRLRSGKTRPLNCHIRHRHHRLRIILRQDGVASTTSIPSIPTSTRRHLHRFGSLPLLLQCSHVRFEVVSKLLLLAHVPAPRRCLHRCGRRHL